MTLSARHRVLIPALLVVAPGRKSFAVLPLPEFWVFFELGSTKFAHINGHSDQEATIAEFVRQWEIFDRRNVAIEGHCDTAEIGTGVSRARAELVHDRVVELGIPWSKIVIRDKEALEPLIPTGPDFPEIQNRGVELRFLR